jgi:uncharacterized membrane protein (TIGR02234 family)
VLVGGCIALSAVLAMTAPISAVEPLVTAATGIAGHASVAALVATVPATVWPSVALASGVLLAVLGVAIVLTGRAWPVSVRKYEPVRFGPAGQGAGQERAVSDWDALSEGEDPTTQPASGPPDLQ